MVNVVQSNGTPSGVVCLVRRLTNDVAVSTDMVAITFGPFKDI
jgi:hypothetical protein